MKAITAYWLRTIAVGIAIGTHVTAMEAEDFFNHKSLLYSPALSTALLAVVWTTTLWLTRKEE